jgi:hypothetical protein
MMRGSWTCRLTLVHRPGSRPAVPWWRELKAVHGLSQATCGDYGDIGFGLWRRARKWSAGGEERIANRSRSATPAAEPQTEARRPCVPLDNSACDERAICEVERAWSKGRQGRPAARGAERIARWSRRG